MITQFQTLLKIPKKTKPIINERKIECIPLKKPVDQSIHSSVLISERNSSIRNVVNSTYFNSQSSFSRNNSLHSLNQSKVFPNISSNINKKSVKKLMSSQVSQSVQSFKSISTLKQSPNKNIKSQEIKQTTIQQLLKKYIDTNFIQSLMLFTNKQWSQQQQILLKQKRFQALKNVIIQKTNQINSLVQDFLLLQYQKYTENQRKMIISFLFKLNNQVLKQYQSLFIQILKKIPEDKIIRQQTQIQQLHAKLIDIFDPKYISSTEKMKERVQLFMQGYTLKKNNLMAGIATKLKPNLDFINQMQRYLYSYQKQLIRVRNQLSTSQLQKNKVNALLKKKANFTPIQIDFQRLKQIKDESKKQFFEDLDGNFINFHQQQHKRSDSTIKLQLKQNQTLKLQLQQQRQKLKNLRQQLQTIKNSVPKTQQTGTQVFLLTQKKGTQISSITSSNLARFLQNISTPFTFNQKITGALINLLSIDKILYDYEVIKHKGHFQPFSQYLMSWILIRTGSKRIAQIFTKNFMYSVKELRSRHKRFNLFSKICGFNGFRKKSIQEDLQYIFFQTHKAWYCLIKLAMMYRKKLNDNPTGYHLLPPMQCQGIFKLPLRKIYQIIQQFLKSQGIQIPEDLTNQIDYYAINQISKFKMHDEQFQKEQLQQIHILRQINFDIISGFVLEYIAKEKCAILEKLLRAITMKQKETGDVLGYFQFQAIYRKFYKERRAKIQNIYSRICQLNQHDMLDIQNAEPIIRAIIQDQSGLRNIFEEIQSLKVLILTEKSNLKSDKIVVNANSYENFRQRYYFEFYDFYNTTFFLEQVFRVIKTLVKKKLRNYIKNQQQLQKLVQQKKPLKLNDQQNKQQNQKKVEQSEEDQDDQDQYSDEQGNKNTPKEQRKQIDINKKKNELQSKIQQWGKIIVRVPHFGQKILTVDQIIVHNMRRKEMIEASQFAWRTLRDILTMISKQ